MTELKPQVAPTVLTGIQVRSCNTSVLHDCPRHDRHVPTVTSRTNITYRPRRRCPSRSVSLRRHTRYPAPAPVSPWQRCLSSRTPPAASRSPVRNRRSQSRAMTGVSQNMDIKRTGASGGDRDARMGCEESLHMFCVDGMTWIPIKRKPDAAVKHNRHDTPSIHHRPAR